MNDPFKIRPNLLPKSDPRYQRWVTSLEKRPPPWNKGKTKNNHQSLEKISQTFKRKKIDNFAAWRQKNKELGIIPTCSPFLKCKELAILIGLILGDGHIEKFPRCERLVITLGTDKPQLIEYTIRLITNIFHKHPSIIRPKIAKCVRLSIYQRNISSRLEIISGSRKDDVIGIPSWIWKNKENLIGCLKGLYEAEASLNYHRPTYTYNFAFHNKNSKLLSDVTHVLTQLGLHPEIRPEAIRIRRKNEVKYLSKLLEFRSY